VKNQRNEPGEIVDPVRNWPIHQKKRMMMKKWINWHLKKGAVGVVGEKSQQKKQSHGKKKPSTALRRKNGGTPEGYSG
jgi:hypothetical protein